jgi:hypothetical protein
MSKAIKDLYTGAGLTPPEGKGIHTKRFHEIAVSYLKKGFSKEEAYKRAMGGLGRNLAVKKSHWQ